MSYAPGTPMGWQRARSEEQKAVRRRELLAAASRMHRHRPLDEISLTAIAKEANISKANVYRYFESREQLFLELTLQEARAWAAQLEPVLGGLPSATPNRIASAFARAYADHPTLCRLIAVLSTVLERNVSSETVANFKLSFVALVTPVGTQLRRLRPDWSLEAAPLFLHHAHFLAGALWSATHPPASVCTALARPELALVSLDFERDFLTMVETFVHGLDAASKAAVDPKGAPTDR